MKLQTTRIYKEIEKAVDSGYTTISLQGSSRSSKTYNTLIFLIVYCCKYPETRLSIVRKTMPAIKGSVMVDFKEIMQKVNLWNDKSMNKSECIYTFPNGSWVDFFSCADEQRLRGRKRDVLFVNEANELSVLEWQQLKMRTTRFSIIDFNPSFSEEHWICTDVIPDRRTYHFVSTYKDNPFLEQSIIEEIESLQWKNPSLWRIYGLGERAIVEGLVFPRFNIIKQSQVEELGLFYESFFVGCDWGFTNDPTAIVRVQLIGNRLYLDEVEYKTGMMTSDIINSLKRVTKRKRVNEWTGRLEEFDTAKVISESADPRLVSEIKRAGVYIEPVRKFAGSIEAGIAQMQEYEIYITENSINLQKEFKNYVYSQDREGKWTNLPIDAYNHGIDAVRYVCLMCFKRYKKPFEEIDESILY